MARWEKERIFFNGKEYFRHIKRDIEKAVASIDVESYIFELDSMGNSIAEALVAASKRGVAVRVLVDGIGSSGTASQLASVLEPAGAELRVYNPILDGGLFNIYRRINKRNHRKTWLFDGRIAYVGSMNISENDWKDYGLRVEGNAVAILQSAFQKAWGKTGNWKGIFRMSRYNLSRLESKGNWLLLNNHMFKRRFYYSLFLRQIRNAKMRVWIANAYFLPQIGFIRALCHAGHKGTDVRLLIPKKSDIWFIPWLSSTYYHALIEAGVKIYEYLPGMFHAKARLIDGWVSLGSTNITNRSLLHDLEVDIRVLDPNNVEILEREFLENCRNSHLVEAESAAVIPWYMLLIAKLLRPFRYWL